MKRKCIRFAAMATALCLILGGCAKKDNTDDTSPGTTQPSVIQPEADLMSWDFLVNERTVSVLGSAIDQEQTDPQLLASALKNNRSGIRYGLEEDALVKYDGKNRLWSVALPELLYKDYTAFSDCVLAYGWDDESNTSWIGKFSPDGALVWSHASNCGYNLEAVIVALEDPQGGYTTFSQCSPAHMCMRRYSAQGEMLHESVVQIGRSSIRCAAALESGYAVQLYSYSKNQQSTIIRLDAQGNVTDSYTYGDGSYHYFIQDMAYLDGKLYLSAYSVPKQETDPEDYYDNQSEVSHILSQIDGDTDSDTVLDLMRQNYMAILLVCDAQSLDVVGFHFVAGSVGGDVSVADGTLTWDVADIAQARYAPTADTDSIASFCYIYRYCFSGGELTGRTDTGEAQSFTR